MANLNTKTLANGVGDILAVNDGIDTSTARQVKDGAGNVSPFYLTTTRVGIGTATPECGLDVESAGVAQVRIGRSDSGTTNELGNLYFGNSTDAFLCGVVGLEDGANDSGMLKFNVEKTGVGISTAMTIKSSGNVGIGTTSPEEELQVQSTSFAGISAKQYKASGSFGNTNALAGIQFGARDDNHDAYSAAQIQVEADSNWATNDKGTRFRFYTTTGTTTSEVARLDKAGDWYTNDGTTHSLSDVRVKKDIADLTDGLSIVNQLKPRTFKYNGKGEMGFDDGVTRYGFIADEVLSVASNYVKISTSFIDGVEVDDFKSLSTTKMIPMLVNAIQELSAKVTALESK